MKLNGPDCYSLSVTPEAYKAQRLAGDSPSQERTGFHEFCAKPSLPKLYAVSQGGQPVYIGITRQRMANRFRLGFKADGSNGYHGYAWRHSVSKATLHVWWQEGGDLASMLDIETIEAEVVFLMRQQGQWPKYQTEIHFHPSKAWHRKWAAEVFRHLQHSSA